ncbi:MAG: RagB/SusD family nutrient uptake outer membrane protein, partial [Chitinophagaceae bacterium]|nr:RagB/SusD family nutrient uptake outer membrane protein [Chitinophagaceae bacterium]
MKNIVFVYILILTTTVSCKKEWLDEKPQLSLTVPQTIADYQAILDNAFSFPGMNVASTLGLGEISAGDFYLDNNGWQIGDPYIRNVYIWKEGDNFYEGDDNIGDWINSYAIILNSNIVIEGIDDIIKKGEQDTTAANNVKGMALFFRAYRHFTVAQEFCKPYVSASASTDPGIPLRLNSDFSVVSKRSTVAETYNQIIADLKEAANLITTELPNSKLNKVRPAKVAAYSMLGRVYLSMSNYDSAYYFSDLALSRYNEIMDYNDITQVDPSAAFSFQIFNPETIYYSEIGLSFYFFPSIMFVDTSLYQMYDDNDIRKTALFNPNGAVIDYKGSYTGKYEFFDGLTTSEMLLIRAESSARKGGMQAAADDLNTLLT